jgi:hypothetical protein
MSGRLADGGLNLVTLTLKQAFATFPCAVGYVTRIQQTA